MQTDNKNAHAVNLPIAGGREVKKGPYGSFWYYQVPLLDSKEYERIERGGGRLLVAVADDWSTLVYYALELGIITRMDDARDVLGELKHGVWHVVAFFPKDKVS